MHNVSSLHACAPNLADAAEESCLQKKFVQESKPNLRPQDPSIGDRPDNFDRRHLLLSFQEMVDHGFPLPEVSQDQLVDYDSFHSLHDTFDPVS